jgi:type II secretion system protein G
MAADLFKPKRRGFTLIEMLIVITIIAVLALIIIPRLMLVSQKAKEATLADSLKQLRDSVQRFQADTGVYPTVLHDLVINNPAQLATPNITPGTWNGAYLNGQGGIPGDGLPLNPFVSNTITDDTQHWKYDNTDGWVSVPDALANIPRADGGGTLATY